MSKSYKKGNLKDLLSETLSEISKARKDTFHEVVSEIIERDTGEADQREELDTKPVNLTRGE